jgi:hypothetical protein
MAGVLGGDEGAQVRAIAADDLARALGAVGAGTGEVAGLPVCR